MRKRAPMSCWREQLALLTTQTATHCRGIKVDVVPDVQSAIGNSAPFQNGMNIRGPNGPGS